MHVLYVSFETDEPQETFDRWFLPLVKAAREAPGCIAYDYLLDPESATRRFMFEAWESKAAMAAHVADAAHVEMLALGTIAHGMRDLRITHWTEAAGHRESTRESSDEYVPGRDAIVEPIRLLQQHYLASVKTGP
jgi:quinol monooxygenase YgiN